MGHTYSSNLQHIVFSTKDRRPQIADELHPKLHAYLSGIAKNLDIDLIASGGVGDHVHLFIAVPPKNSISEIVQKIKANSSRWMREQVNDFSWQEGYGSFSVSASQAESVKAYVAKQREHHASRDFRAEFITLLTKCGVHFDPSEV